MLVDHVGFLFFPDQIVFRMIGRMAFPLFAFLVAEGYERTSNLRKYFVRLLAFAAISQPVYMLFRFATDGTTNDLNIFFTLAAGLFAVTLWDKLPLASSIPAIALIAGLAQFLGFDYGVYGVMSVPLSRLILYHRKWGIAVLLLLPQIPVLVRFLWGVISIQTYAAMSVPLIALYNGQRGRVLPRLFFYAFYPGHLFVLWLIWYVIH
ncbi:MAG: hypothetical protein A2849_00190 [Candidatus Taylorbacteria bacterium RIFCSPHIGHO2_01_FULL_51_15]|uniref:TraX family protein n=1 Tax=Candidatus Taylorbacteria bacterium RIFCSPHIGHO2_01_FULL_51_15 TaxID=1802304 RepID=A0A1G2MBV4_9BACT|nr:MAG: hypothetical protein A2849_00190 [Candidatus Taylorbacteria bacterium RIFCSPHIGHO2_01_FULL_51_15]